MNKVLMIALGILASPVVHASPSDAWITTKAKIALMTTDGVSANSIHVDTTNGDVVLHGKVTTREEKQAAQIAVAKLERVRKVRNLLQIVPAPIEKATVLADERLKHDADLVIAGRNQIDGSHMKVVSVDLGVVLLSGSTRSLVDQLRAIESVASLTGVRHVASEITSPDMLADAQLGMARTSHKVGTGAQDLWITAETKMRLLADGDVPALDLNVDTRAGKVTLFGIVASNDAKESAERDARKVSGVVTVSNEIEIVPESKQSYVAAKDDEIKRDLKATVAGNAEFKNVDLDVKDGVVRLTGRVNSVWQRLNVATTARATKGVRSVRDDMQVGKSQKGD